MVALYPSTNFCTRGRTVSYTHVWSASSGMTLSKVKPLPPRDAWIWFVSGWTVRAWPAPADTSLSFSLTNAHTHAHTHAYTDAPLAAHTVMVVLHTQGMYVSDTRPKQCRGKQGGSAQCPRLWVEVGGRGSGSLKKQESRTTSAPPPRAQSTPGDRTLARYVCNVSDGAYLTCARAPPPPPLCLPLHPASQQPKSRHAENRRVNGQKRPYQSTGRTPPSSASCVSPSGPGFNIRTSHSIASQEHGVLLSSNQVEEGEGRTSHACQRQR